MGQFNSLLHHRRSIRLKGFDYSLSGLYFITICVQDRLNLFGEIVPVKRAPTRGAPTFDPEFTMQLNEAGIMIEQQWLALPQRFPEIVLHEFVVMPNHFHGIIEIVGAPLVGALTHHDPAFAIPENTELGNQQPGKGQPQGIVPTKTIGDIIGAFKSITTNAYINGIKTRNWKPFNVRLWQRNYWEHIIREEKTFLLISDYIWNNPANWPNDTLNPDAVPKQKSLSDS